MDCNTADYVSVIRCVDCKYFSKFDSQTANILYPNTGWCTKFNCGIHAVSDLDYCSHAKRRKINV